MKKYSKILLMCFFSLSIHSSVFAGFKDNLTLYYDFDIDNGSVVDDLSGNAHAGSVNGATYSLNGVKGGAYYFDGNDYILAGNLGQHVTGSISFWMNADVVEDFRNPFSTEYAGGDDTIRFEVNSSGELIGGGHGLGRGGEYTRHLSAKQWVHVVYVWDENFTYGYFNGEFKFKNPHPDPASIVHPDIPTPSAGEFKEITLNFNNVAIGNGYSESVERFWKGLIDEVRVYSRPLSPQEVQQLHSLKDSDLLIYYTFDTYNGSTVDDQSSYDRDGIVVGGMSLVSDGVLNGAYEFDGNSGRVMIGNMGHLEEGTVSFWANTRDFPFIQHPNAFTSRFNWGDSSVRFETDENGNFYVGGNPFIFQSGLLTTDFKPNQWYHVALTWSGATGARVYFNGEQKASLPASFMFSKEFLDVAIGTGYFDQADRYWEGKIDEFRLYKRDLTPLEIQGLYNAQTLGLVYQNFEPDNGTPPSPVNPGGGPEYCFGINAATASDSTEEAHTGTQSCKIVSNGPFGGAGFPAQTQTYNVNFEANRHDRLTFWIWADPLNNSDNDVRVRFFDHNLYKDEGNPFNGFEVFSARRAAQNEWTKITILLSQLPSDFDFSSVDKINIVNEFSGTYYIDDIHVSSDDRYFQTFEAGYCHGFNSNCGWTWDGNVTQQTQNVHEGEVAWKLQTNNNPWSGTGIAWQDKANEGIYSKFESHFHPDLNPAHLNPQSYDKLSFWLYQQAQNQMDNNINVQFFDHQDYSVNPIHFWTKQTGSEGKWKRVVVPFEDVLAEALKLNINSTFNFNDMDKLQFQIFWPGTYLLDDIRASKSPILNIDPVHLSSGIVAWESFVGAAQYTLEESTGSPNGPWQVVYTGSDALFITNRLTPSWLRVRWETEGDNNAYLVPYASDWSDAVYYQPKPTLIKHAYLQQGAVDWAFIPQTNVYEIEEGDTKNGPWTRIYQGGYTINPVLAVPGKWYRARGVELNSNDQVVQAADWSPVLAFNTTSFIAASGRVLREANGQGDEIILKGINLGNLLLIEPWMFFGDQDPLKQIFPDDWTIRKLFLERDDTEPADLDQLLRTYQNAYLTENDLNDLFRMGGNFVRLPVHYLNIRETDETGQWVGNGFNFEAIDRIIQMCADRGLGVLLDLHGAPGSQSKEFHTGRSSPPTPSVDGFYHQLFNPNDDTYRQRTVELWTEIARRYKDNSVVVGYDILNEPFGALDPVYYSSNQDGYLALWSLYDRIYDAIRDPSGAGDTNHLIVMEGIPSARDWESLPNPSSMGWQNVAYELHYYGFTFDSEGNINGTLDPAGHAAYLNDKVTHSRQSQYQVPVLIGEFNGFNQRANWNYYCQVIRNQGWSWSMWSSKTHDSPSEWGMYNHSRYDESLPDFRIDSLPDLQKKLSKYATLRYHTANESMREIVADGFDACPALPDLTTSITTTILPQAVVDAGAQWRLLSGPDTLWKNSGQIIQDLPSGTYAVRFRNINGWQRPVQQIAQLTAFNNLHLQGTYVRNPEGSVTANIQPQSAINAGAQWRLTTGPDTNWKNSGDLVTVPAGNYTVSFKKVRRFTKPSNVSITVSSGQTISVTGTYR